MTDRLKGLTVVLDKDYRTDDAEAIINAIGMIRGVGKVVPLISTPSDQIDRIRIAKDMELAIYEALHKVAK
jgi:hypothetical protein